MNASSASRGDAFTPSDKRGVDSNQTVIEMVQAREGAANSEYMRYLRVCTEVWRQYKAARCRGESPSPPSPPTPWESIHPPSPDPPAKRCRTTFDLYRQPPDA